MKFIGHLSVMLKIAVPLTLMGLMAIGLVVYARASLNSVLEQTNHFADVATVRQESYLRAQLHATDAALLSRNIVVETQQEVMNQYKARYDGATKTALVYVDKLIALAETPERRKIGHDLRQMFETYFGILDRSIVFAMQNDAAKAMKVIQDEGRPARAKLYALIEERSQRVTDEMQARKHALELEVSNTVQSLIVIAALGLTAVVALSGFIVMFGITRPLASLVLVLQRMAKGDIDAEIVEARRGDEIGAVGKAVEGIKAMVARKAAEEADIRRLAEEVAQAERQRTMIAMADSFEGAVGGIIQMVSASATELQATAQTDDRQRPRRRRAQSIHRRGRRRGGRHQRQHGRGGRRGIGRRRCRRSVAKCQRFGRCSLRAAVSRGRPDGVHLVQALSQTTSARIGDMVGHDLDHRQPRPTCWRSMPRSRRRAPAWRGGASRWWRAR